MKIYVTFGLAMALGFLLIAVLLFYLGLHSDAAKYEGAQLIGTVACGIIGVAGISAGIKAERNRRPPNANFTYGEGVKAGVLISVFLGLFGAVTNFVYTQFINPAFPEIMVQARLLSVKAAGATAQEVAATEKMVRSFMHPAIQAGIGIVFTIIAGTIVSLIVAALLKRKVTAGRFGK